MYVVNNRDFPRAMKLVLQKSFVFHVVLCGYEALALSKSDAAPLENREKNSLVQYVLAYDLLNRAV